MLESKKQIGGKYWLGFEADDEAEGVGIPVHANLIYHATIRGRLYPATCGTIHHVGRIEMQRDGRARAFVRVRPTPETGALARAMEALMGTYPGAQTALNAIAAHYDPRNDALQLPKAA